MRAGLELLLPFADLVRVVSGLREHDRIDDAGDFRHCFVEVPAALEAPDVCDSVVLVLLGVDAAGLSDGQPRDFLLLFRFVCLRSLNDL